MTTREPPGQPFAPHCGAADDDYVCTLRLGHDGPDHVADDSDGTVCHRWPVAGPQRPVPIGYLCLSQPDVHAPEVALYQSIGSPPLAVVTLGQDGGYPAMHVRSADGARALAAAFTEAARLLETCPECGALLPGRRLVLVQPRGQELRDRHPVTVPSAPGGRLCLQVADQLAALPLLGALSARAYAHRTVSRRRASRCHRRRDLPSRVLHR